MLAPRAKLWSTPLEVVEQALGLLAPGPGDTVFDIGCGDGRLIIECAKSTDAAAVVGVEIDEARAMSVVRRIEGEGVADRCAVLCANAMEADYSKATCIYAYLVPRGYRLLLPVLKRKICRPVRLVTYMSPLPSSEKPLRRVGVATAQHPDARWPLFLYDLHPADTEAGNAFVAVSGQDDRATGRGGGEGGGGIGEGGGGGGAAATAGANPAAVSKGNDDDSEAATAAAGTAAPAAAASTSATQRQLLEGGSGSADAGEAAVDVEVAAGEGAPRELVRPLQPE